MHFFFKPIVKLPELPLINKSLQADYDKIQTKAQLIEFVFKKLNEYDNTNSLIKKEAIKAIAFPLYSCITNLSYESKIQLL